MRETNHPLYLSYLLSKRDNSKTFEENAEANRHLNVELKKQGLI